MQLFTEQHEATTLKKLHLQHAARFYFHTLLFSYWRSYVPANAIYEMCGELTPSPLSWSM